VAPRTGARSSACGDLHSLIRDVEGCEHGSDGHLSLDCGSCLAGQLSRGRFRLTMRMCLRIQYRPCRHINHHGCEHGGTGHLPLDRGSYLAGWLLFRRFCLTMCTCRSVQYRLRRTSITTSIVDIAHATGSAVFKNVLQPSGRAIRAVVIAIATPAQNIMRLGATTVVAAVQAAGQAVVDAALVVGKAVKTLGMATRAAADDALAGIKRAAKMIRRFVLHAAGRGSRSRKGDYPKQYDSNLHSAATDIDCMATAATPPVATKRKNAGALELPSFLHGHYMDMAMYLLSDSVTVTDRTHSEV